jgi:hypothetical protein
LISRNEFLFGMSLYFDRPVEGSLVLRGGHFDRLSANGNWLRLRNLRTRFGSLSGHLDRLSANGNWLRLRNLRTRFGLAGRALRQAQCERKLVVAAKSHSPFGLETRESFLQREVSKARRVCALASIPQPERDLLDLLDLRDFAGLAGLADLRDLPTSDRFAFQDITSP